MAIFIDACREGTEWRYRLWDSQAGRYATGDLGIVGLITNLWYLLRPSGVPECPDANAAIAKWIEQARERGSSDPSLALVKVAKRAWRTPDEPASSAGPIREALRSAALAEQTVRAILEIRVAEWTAVLSPDARALLTKSYVLHELLRGTGKATIIVNRAKDAYKGVANVRPLIAEIATAWADAVTVESIDPDNANSTVYTFRLR